MIDLNCDMGELPELLNDGTQEALLGCVTSVNIACGGHAGDEHLMAATLAGALRHGVRIGAHPGYPDRANFGRLELSMSPQDIADTVEQQLHALLAVARRAGATIGHGKPHGALYNAAATDQATAAAIATGFARLLPGLPLMGLAGSSMLNVFASHGFPVLPEAFADRRYEADGTLRSRRYPDALITDPKEAAAQAVSIARHGTLKATTGETIHLEARTLCIHSDTRGSVEIARAVRNALEQAERLAG